MAPIVTPCSTGAAWTEAHEAPGFKAVQMNPWLSLLLDFMGVICHELHFLCRLQSLMSYRSLEALHLLMLKLLQPIYTFM